MKSQRFVLCWMKRKILPMTDFLIVFIPHFLFSNIVIAILAGIFVLLQHCCKKYLTARTLYQMWLLFLGILTIPFVPVSAINFFSKLLFNRISNERFHLLSDLVSDLLHKVFSLLHSGTEENSSQTSAFSSSQWTSFFSHSTSAETGNWIKDFAVSITGQTPSIWIWILFLVWILGIFVMSLQFVRSWLQLHRICRAALPLENQEISALFQRCLQERKIQREISIYTSAYISSPFTTGVRKPQIYFPLYLISDYNEKNCRFMLLHELEHCKHNDAFANYLMNLSNIIYWFHPLVWYALKEMQTAREISCDSAVLNGLDEREYKDYGNTLIHLAETMPHSPFLFVSKMGGSFQQIRKRILNIARFQRDSKRKKMISVSVLILLSLFLTGLIPLLSNAGSDLILAEETDNLDNSTNMDTFSKFTQNAQNTSQLELSKYFSDEGYTGTFVLYDTASEQWQIYNQEQAHKRVAPDSTYKIYDALFALEEQVITPEDSQILWNYISYPFSEWNQNQTLDSAMENSVNWYFQELDSRMGKSCIQNYLDKIGYGNKKMGDDISSYWLESTLKISALEQVELLKALYNNTFDFSSENIRAVKDSLCLIPNSQNSENDFQNSDSDSQNPSYHSKCSIYGKTGTGRVNEQDINGWFIGYIEKSGSTCFFATNIQGKDGATGSNAAKITFAIFDELGMDYNSTR